MIVTSGISMQFGAKPLFENVSVKFGDGNRYGLIGANGCGKSTFMKILGGDLEPSAGSVAIDSSERVGKLRQDQFAYEDERVLDVVLMGHAEMWAAMRERDAIYANPDASEEDFLHAADLEAKYAEYGGYTAEARAGELLLGLGVPTEQHDGPDERGGAGLEAARAAGAGAVRRPGHPAARRADQQPRHQQHPLAGGRAQPRAPAPWSSSRTTGTSSPACARTWRTWTTAASASIRATTTTTWKPRRSRKQQQLNDNAKAKDRIADLQDFVRRFRAHKAKARQATSRTKQIEKLKVEDVKPSSRQYPFIRFLVDEKEKLHRLAVEAKGLSKGYGKKVLFKDLDLAIEAGEKVAIIGPNGIGKTTLLRCLRERSEADAAR